MLKYGLTIIDFDCAGAAIKFGDFSAARQIVAAQRLGSARVVPPPSAGKMPLVGNAREGPEAPSTRAFYSGA